MEAEAEAEDFQEAVVAGNLEAVVVVAAAAAAVVAVVAAARIAVDIVLDTAVYIAVSFHQWVAVFEFLLAVGILLRAV